MHGTVNGCTDVACRRGLLTCHYASIVLIIDLKKQVGDELTATVTDVKDFGAIVEILRGRMGLLHMTEISHHASGKPVATLLKVTAHCTAI
jgi:polyribonucleotide nucleotidyltransferase